MDLWNILQAKEWAAYKESPVGVFSVDGLRGAEITGEIINNTIPDGICLDVGCGVLETPYYMKVADSVEFFGIDPYKEVKRRTFVFKEGYAENLPWEDKFFDGVLFATSLDHVKSPAASISEAHRVLKDDGHLFVWVSLRKNDAQFRKWESAPKPCQYDKYHMWAFNKRSLISLMNGFKLDQCIKVNKRGGESVFVLKKIL